MDTRDTNRLNCIEKRHKKVKDKNAPKKPVSAFFCYQKVRRPILKQEKPELGNKDLVAVSFDHTLENVGGMEEL